jgi:hypothetical protein
MEPSLGIDLCLLMSRYFSWARLSFCFPFLPCQFQDRRRSWVSFWRKWYCFALLQRVQPWDKLYQYLLFAAEPYEIIAFKVITQLISVQMDLFWASPVQEELGAKGLVQSAFFHVWTNTDMYRVQEVVTTTLYVTLSMPWHRCLLLQGQTEMKWSLPLQVCCSLNEDIIGFN